MTQNETWDQFTQKEKVKLIQTRLPRGSQQKKVIVVGAGMAGLVASCELQKAGHKVIMLEAQHRVGGRVWTLREPFTHGLYAEAGAMRIPESHKLTLEYIDRANLASKKDEFIMSSSEGIYYFNGEYASASEYERDPWRLKFNMRPRRKEGARLLCDDSGTGSERTAMELWEDVIEGIKANPRFYKNESDKPDWDNLSKAFDRFSTLDFLEQGGRSNDGAEELFEPWTYNEIYMFGQIEGWHARLNNSVVALLHEHFSLLSKKQKYYYLEGGMDQLPLWFFQELGKQQVDIRFGAKVEEIDQEADGRVIVRYHTAAQGGHLEEKCDHLVVAIPFPTLRHMRGIEWFTPEKRRAIYALNYSAAGKILLQCRERFWEKKQIYGGRSQTDLALRSVWYPQHGKETGRGVLLASYTWGRDAERWGHLQEHDRIRRAIKRLNELHPDAGIIERGIVEVGVSIMWQNQEFAGAGFALFNPHQESFHRTNLQKVEALKKEGAQSIPARIHFAGEHTSPAFHRWIEGAVDSGLRVAWEINDQIDWR